MNNTRIMVLGMLMQRPMHGYDIQKGLEQNRTDLWADVLPGSIYHSLKKMASEGLVQMQTTERTGNRLRAIYAITPEGRAEFRRLLLHAWRTPPRSFPTGINTALTFLNEIPREEIQEALDDLIRALEREVENWNAGESFKAEKDLLTEPIRASFDNGREHLEADLRFLHRLKEVI